VGNDRGVIDAELPAIPTSAGALIFDRASRLLILKPTYKTGWTIPGGVMEAGGETPWDACRREVREECGLEMRSGRLACVDFRPARPRRPGGIRFLFDCGQAADTVLSAITVQPEEIEVSDESYYRDGRIFVALIFGSTQEPSFAPAIETVDGIFVRVLSGT